MAPPYVKNPTSEASQRLERMKPADIYKKKHNVVRNSILAGSLAGISSTLVVHPFDVIRTKVQSTTQKEIINGASSRVIASSSVHKALRQTLQNGGFRALYAGLSMPLFAQAIYKSSIFSINNLCQGYLLERKRHVRNQEQQKSNPQLAIMDLFWCGVIAGAINAAAFVTPVEFVRNKLIVESSIKAVSTFNGPLHVIRTTLASSEGILGLWKGIGLTIARDSVGCGFFFASMALCQRTLMGGDNKTPTFGVTVLSGMCAGLGFWTAALPLDTLKTWRQTSNATSTKTILLESIRKHGWKATAQHLTRGWPVAFGRGAPSAAITIITYKYCYDALEAM
mmetsp:Transcript_15996/g.24215  ORF Transcript_15996/g.24215 Transcript_15996/m.24215 type:complete len:338 (+) Transcript_15996:333-1346(+)